MKASSLKVMQRSFSSTKGRGSQYLLSNRNEPFIIIGKKLLRK